MHIDNQSPDQQPDSVSNLDGIVLIALLFSCCLAPLGLAALAFVSTWTSSLTAFNPFRPWLLAIAMMSSVIAWRQIYRPRAACASEKSCAAPRAGFGAKVIFWVATVSIGYVLGLPYVERYF